MTPASTRRRFLAGCGASLAVGLAGCLGRNSQDPGTPRDGTPTDAETPRDDTPTDAETPDRDASSPVLWETPLGTAPTPVAVAGELAYVGTEAGDVYALETGDGRERWSDAVDEQVRGRPVVADGTVFVVSGETALGAHHVVTAFDADTGEERWQFRPGEWWLDVVGVADGLLYVGTSDDALGGKGETLYAVRIDSKEVAWSAEIGDGGRGLVANDAVYVPSFGKLYAYDATDGTRRWSRPLRGYSARTVAATRETICYVADEDGTRGTLVGRDVGTGDLVWSFDDWMAGSTTLRGGVLYVGGERLAAFDPDTGDRHWETEDSGFVPRAPVRDGTLYAGGDALRAYEIEDGTREWSWSPEQAVEGVVPAGGTAETVYLDTFRDADPRNRYKYAVDTRSAQQRWLFDAETQLSDLTRGGERVFVAGDDGSVYAIGRE